MRWPWDWNIQDIKYILAWFCLYLIINEVILKPLRRIEEKLDRLNNRDD